MNRAQSQGYVLMVVAVALVVIATSSLALFASTNENSQQLNTSYQVQQLDYALDAAVAHTKAQLLSYTSCSGYTDLNGALNEATYTSTFNTSSGSPIKATVSATHMSGIQRTTVIELNSYTTTANLSLEPVEDTHIKKDKPEENKGSDSKMHSQAKGDDKDEHMLMLFDLSAIPAESMVAQATLQMRIATSDNDNDPDNIYRVARSWNADEATWQKYEAGSLSFWSEPGGQHQQHIWGSFPASSETTHLADITDLVDLWHGGLPNYGMLLRSEFDADNSHKHYFSSDENAANKRPKLLIEYRCECGSSC